MEEHSKNIVAEKLEEIEVTEEMIEAGAKVIIDYFHLAPDWLPNDISVEVYRAMSAARNVERRPS